MAKQKKLRIYFSWVLVLLIVVITLVSSSAWNAQRSVTSLILFLVAIVLVGIATLGRVWCSLYIAGYKTKTLVTEGPYSVCRNPLYVFSFLGSIGAGFATGTFLIPSIIAIAFLLYYPLVIKREERKLQSTHGEDYEAYCDRVPSLIPKLSLLKEPKEYTVNPIVIRRHLFDAIWFIWVIGLIEIVKVLHIKKILPVIFTIY